MTDQKEMTPKERVEYLERMFYKNMQSIYERLDSLTDMVIKLQKECVKITPFHGTIEFESGHCDHKGQNEQIILAVSKKCVGAKCSKCGELRYFI